jgi:hypothetical protein
MVAEYDPDREFVVTLLKPDDHINTYRLHAPETESSEWDWQYLQDREVALAIATQAEMLNRAMADCQRLTLRSVGTLPQSHGRDRAAKEVQRRRRGLAKSSIVLRILNAGRVRQG